LSVYKQLEKPQEARLALRKQELYYQGFKLNNELVPVEKAIIIITVRYY